MPRRFHGPRTGRIQTGPLPKLPESAFAGPVTLERWWLPGMVVAGLVVLLGIQLFLRMV